MSSIDARQREAWEGLRDCDGPFDFEAEYVLERSPAPTGIKALDDRLGGGLHAGTYTLIGGDPGSGKTALACKAVYTQACLGLRPIFYSFEMTKMQLVSRLLSVHTRMSRDTGNPLPQLKWASLRSNLKMGEDELRRLADADERTRYEAVMRYMREHGKDDDVLRAWDDFKRTVFPSMIVRDDVRDIAQVADEVTGICESGLHPSVIVDYLQLAAAGDGDEYRLVTEASHTLQKLAKRNTIPVLLVSSLRNLNKAERDDDPQLSQFRGSGHVGYDAGAAIVLRKSGGLDTIRGVGVCQPITAHVIKNRFGEVGEVPLAFNGGMNVFLGMEGAQE